MGSFFAKDVLSRHTNAYHTLAVTFQSLLSGNMQEYHVIWYAWCLYAVWLTQTIVLQLESRCRVSKQHVVVHEVRGFILRFFSEGVHVIYNQLYFVSPREGAQHSLLD